MFGVIDRLSLEELRAGRYFFLHFNNLRFQWFRTGGNHGAETEFGTSFKFEAGEVFTFLELFGSEQERDRVQVEDAFSLRMVTEGDVVAGEAEHVLYPQHRGAEEV